MMTRRVFPAVFFFLLSAAFPHPSHGSEQPLQVFLADIYKTYQGKDVRGIGADSPRFAALVTPGLLRLVKTDARRAARRGKAPTLDGDPFVDAQDWEISALTIDVKEEGAKATARIAFKNAGAARSVTLNLVKAKDGGWRIDDFIGSGGSLRKMLRGK